MEQDIMRWFLQGETGISSEALAAALLGMKPNKRWANWNHPKDPDDFRRCVQFLDAVPEARAHLSKVAALSTVWAMLVEHWEEIERLLTEELPSGRAPKTYKRMKELGC